MSSVMPSQVVQTVDELFPHATKGVPGAQLDAQHSSKLLGILNLLKAVPVELINLSSADYAELVLATSTIEEHLEVWRSRGNVGNMAHVKGYDAVTVIRRALALCPDEYPPASTTELSFIKDADLRESIRRDTGAANRALSNSEWKAATVLAGAAIEALLLWRLQEPSPGSAAISAAVGSLVTAQTITKPSNTMERWELHHLIEMASHLNFLKTDTASAVRLARNFRNLIHPGRAARLAQACDRATSYSAIGALEHVIRDLS
jgi:hypothetical protein